MKLDIIGDGRSRVWLYLRGTRCIPILPCTGALVVETVWMRSLRDWLGDWLGAGDERGRLRDAFLMASDVLLEQRKR